jgi:hypothetical protein
MVVKIARPIEEVVDIPVMDNPLDMVNTEQAGDMVSEEELQRAMNCEQVVLRIKRQTVIHFVEMGRVLKEIRDHSYYKLLGYDDFQEWCESPEIDFSRRTVYRYITLVEKLIDTGLYTVQEIEAKSIYKLAAIANHATPEDRLDHLLGLSTNDFKVELARVVEERKGHPAPKSGKVTSGADPFKEPLKVDLQTGPVPASMGAPDENVEEADWEKVGPEAEEEETVEPFNMDDFGLKGLFRLVPVRTRPSEEYVDFPEVKMKATVFVKQTADGKEFLLEL